MYCKEIINSLKTDYVVLTITSDEHIFLNKIILISVHLISTKCTHKMWTIAVLERVPIVLG